MRIIPRSEWGARPATNRTIIARSRRRAFVVHYSDSRPTTRTGAVMMKFLQNYHMNNNGWADIGYNFVIDQNGDIFEGRGLDVLGAHAGSTGNVEGIGVQIHIGGDQEPSPAALRAAVWLKAEADRLLARTLVWKNHGDYMATSCAGVPLRRWLAAGRPLDTEAPVPGWDGKPVRGGVVSTPYGRRGPYWSTDRDRNGNGIHTGDDYAVPEGTPVYALVAGTVTIADGGALGLMSILKGDNGRYYRYCHLKRGSRSPWNGERVRAGQQIARSGNTGSTTGPHLHLEDTATAQIWPPVGHRKPSWPTPIPSTKEDDMPEVHVALTQFKHPGGAYSLPYPEGKRWPDVDLAVPVASDAYTAYAQIIAPEGVEIRSRWVYESHGWTRYAETPHEKNVAETVHVGEAPAPLVVDIWASEPCVITVVQRSIYWPAA